MLAAMMQRSLAGLSAATVPHRAAALQQVILGNIFPVSLQSQPRSSPWQTFLTSTRRSAAGQHSLHRSLASTSRPVYITCQGMASCLEGPGILSHVKLHPYSTRDKCGIGNGRATNLTSATSANSNTRDTSTPAAGDTTTSSSTLTITTLADLAAVFSQASSSSSSKGHLEKLTIDLDGRTLDGEVPGHELRLEGKHAHVCVTNGRLLLPVGCGFTVDRGATLELVGLHITCDWDGDGYSPPAVMASGRGTRLLLHDCSITAVGRVGVIMNVPMAVFVNAGAELTMRRCWIESTFSGVHVWGGGTRAVVEACGAMHCEISGFSSSYGGVLEAYRCLALRNGLSGFLAHRKGTELRAVDCRSEHNGHAGFHAEDEALMVVDACATSGNDYGYLAEEQAELCLRGVCSADERKKARIEYHDGRYKDLL